MDSGASLDFVQRVVQDAQVKLILRDQQQPELPKGVSSLVINHSHDVICDSPPPPS